MVHHSAPLQPLLVWVGTWVGNFRSFEFGNNVSRLGDQIWSAPGTISSNNIKILGLSLLRLISRGSIRGIILGNRDKHLSEPTSVALLDMMHTKIEGSAISGSGS